MEDATKCGREIGIATLGIECHCTRMRGHADLCSGPVYSADGKYVGDLEDGCTPTPTATITFARGRSFDWEDNVK